MLFVVVVEAFERKAAGKLPVRKKATSLQVAGQFKGEIENK